MAAADWYLWEGTDLVLQVRVQPRAGRDEITGVQAGRLRVRLTAPPVDGKANLHLCRFLADAFAVPPSRVSLIAGATRRDKRLRINTPRHLPWDIQPPQQSA
ncbi:MAG: DUF167 family protein [Candidatus Competibacteraceae bacterium]